MSYIYRIPAEFVAQHKADLEQWDWSKPFPLVDVVPAGGFSAYDKLVVSDGKVRSIEPRTARRMRRYADLLPPQPKPTPEEIAEVLRRRNPVSKS